MGAALVQTKGRVWDILNAGPFHRFTVSGVLVHNCLILDHSDTTLRLGFVTDIQRGLDDGTLEGKDAADAERQEIEKTPKTRECPSCHSLRTGGGPCPNCGFVEPRKTAVETKDGELRELDQERKEGNKANNSTSWAEKAAFIAQLRGYAKAHGKADGWVAHKYRAKFGVWPNDPRVKYGEPAKFISPEVSSWIKSQNIRFIKGQQKASA